MQSLRDGKSPVLEADQQEGRAGGDRAEEEVASGKWEEVASEIECNFLVQ